MEKCSLFEAELGKRSHKCERYQDGLRVRKMRCLCGEIKAHLVWTPNNEASKYNVTWRELSCKRELHNRGIFRFHPKIVSEVTKVS